MTAIRVLISSILLLLALGVATADDPYPDAVTVFTREADDAYAAIRIPAIVQSKTGALLAFAEGRPLDNDHGENDILLRRSTDGGKTWDATRVIAESGRDSLNDPCAIALHDPDRILLVYHRYPQGYHGRVMAHTKLLELGYGGPANAQSFLITSEDDGLTWSAPRELTRELRAPDAIAVGSPGNFIQIAHGPNQGRLVLPLYENLPVGEGDRMHYLRAAISDDLGDTWRLGERVSYAEITGWGTEAQIAETEGGVLVMSARLMDGAVPARILCESRDGGESWTPARLDPTLETPPCMSSIVSRFDADGKAVLFHSLPKTAEERANGQLYRSTDGGATWTHDSAIYSGDFAYSALVVLNDGRIGCLYERDHYKTISYAVLDAE
ncbi:MAG: exo-alpha-sialidase [Candidatus Hydrogenedentes bacterium]|nr:exo-alpha-sialidase [Candidatus Hydrogenedentota bacterium]